jgi:hypothetical protein
MFLIQKCSPLLCFLLLLPFFFQRSRFVFRFSASFRLSPVRGATEREEKSLPVFVIALRVMCRMMWLLVCASTNTRRLSSFILLRSSSFRYLVPPDVAPDRSRGEEDEKDGG